MNVFYTYLLKNVPIVDIFCIATGFLLRVYAGGEAISVPISSWMLVTVLCLALYLAVIKRLQELRASYEAKRQVLSIYTEKLLENYSLIAHVLTLVFYSLFVLTERPGLWVTIPVVLFGFFRYWFLVEVRGEGESPTDIVLEDPVMLFILMAWTGLCVWRLY